MNEISDTKGEQLLKKLDRRDKLGRGLELFLVVIVLIINMYGLYQIQNIIKTNQAGTLEARKQNVQRQDELKGYIECIVLLGKAHPDINFQISSLEQTKALLDECAKTQ